MKPIDTLSILEKIESKLDLIWNRLEEINKGKNLPYHETIKGLHQIKEDLAKINDDLEHFDVPYSGNDPEKYRTRCNKSRIVNNFHKECREYVQELLVKTVGCDPSLVRRTMYPNGDPDWD